MELLSRCLHPTHAGSSCQERCAAKRPRGHWHTEPLFFLTISNAGGVLLPPALRSALAPRRLDRTTAVPISHGEFDSVWLGTYSRRACSSGGAVADNGDSLAPACKVSSRFKLAIVHSSSCARRPRSSPSCDPFATRWCSGFFTSTCFSRCRCLRSTTSTT